MEHAAQRANAAGMRRGQVTWFSYLMLGFFTYLLNIQGNILRSSRPSWTLATARSVFISARLPSA
jgi:hypothetical protein